MNAPARLALTGARRWIAVLVALLMLLVGTPAAAQTFPQFTGLVTDAANVLPADRKAALEQKLEALQQRTNHQLVVATIPDLQGYDIADYGYRLGRAWGVGLKGADNGVILIVAPNERKVRVEVGYGMEPIVTDALSSIITQQRILPAFKGGDIPGGIEAGADALAQQLSLPDDQAKAKAAEAAQTWNKAHAQGGSGGFPYGVVIWLVIMVVIFGSHLFRRGMGSRPMYRDGGSNWPIWLWAASEIAGDMSRGSGHGSSWGGSSSDGGGSSGGGWGGGGFTGGGGGSFGGGGASGSW